MNIDEIIKVTTEIQSTCYHTKECSECPFSHLTTTVIKGNSFAMCICAFKWTPTTWKLDKLKKKE